MFRDWLQPDGGGSTSARVEPGWVLHHQEWMDQARGAQRAAELAAGAGVHPWACFLSHQCAEMALKGALERCGRDHEGHSVIALLNDLETARPGTTDTESRSAARNLSRLYIPTRYPDAAGTAPGQLYAEDDSRQALADAHALLQLALKTIEVLDATRA